MSRGVSTVEWPALKALRCWASAYLKKDVSEKLPSGAKALGPGGEVPLDALVGSLRDTLPVRQGAPVSCEDVT